MPFSTTSCAKRQTSSLASPGARHGDTPLVYRSVDHRALRDLCSEVRKPTLTPKFLRHAPTVGFGPNIPAFASAVIELQEKRHAADYDPANRFKTSDAKLAIATARSAIRRYQKASPPRRQHFLTLLLFPPR